MDREPIPPEASRADVLGRLKRERWHATDAGEAGLVAEIDRKIQRLSAANTATAPTRETAAMPQRATAARTTKKENRRVAAR